MIRVATKSVEDTRELAAHVASVVEGGEIILLSGDLGAGKTAFTQGFAKGLDVAEPVTSPTFTLVQTYAGRLRVVHIDVYRLEHLQEVIDLGLAELVDEDAVALIEWGEAAAPVLSADFLRVRVEFGEADDDRVFEIEPVGARWSERLADLELAVGKWAA